MTPSAAQSAATNLARVAAAGEEARAVGGKTSRSHAQLLAILQAADAQYSIEELSRQTGLHVNTVRTHLDVLTAGGHVQRIQSEPQGRGRPPLAFRAVGNTRSPFDDLSQTLAETLEVAADPDLARGTAERWADTLGPTAPANSPDEAVGNAVEALRTVGFSAEASALGDSITMGSCPYASLIADHPIICDIHTELLVKVLDASGQDVGVEAIEVGIKVEDVGGKPTLCRARLSRPDLTPARTIPVPPAAVAVHPPAEDSL